MGNHAKNATAAGRIPNSPQGGNAVGAPQPMVGSTNRSSQMSSVRLINEAEFEEVFQDFKRNKISG